MIRIIFEYLFLHVVNSWYGIGSLSFRKYFIIQWKCGGEIVKLNEYKNFMNESSMFVN